MSEGRTWHINGHELPEWWGAAMVADYLEVKRQNVHRIKGLPKPIPRPPAPTVGHDMWLADEIRAFKPIYDQRRRARRKASA